MESKRPEKVDVEFESHPPIEDDLDGVTSLLRQSLLQFVDCQELARHIISLKDITQVVALQGPDEENTSEDDEPDNDIYGVSSVIELPIGSTSGGDRKDSSISKLAKFIIDKFPKLMERLETFDNPKIGLIINERYINLPPQLALPTLKTLTKSLEECKFTHLVWIAKLLMKSRSSDSKLPSKKSKSDQPSSSQDSEPLIFVNPEEEIVFENSKIHSDFDVSAFCDENASWLMNSDIKYTPHRRTMLIDYKDWSKMMGELEKELN